MTAYFIRRLLLIIPTFIGVTFIAFLITRAVPGGPVERALSQMQQGGGEGGARGGSGSQGAKVTEEQRKALEKYFGLDEPTYIAYPKWLWKVMQLDLGISYRYRVPVIDLVKDRLPISLTFGLIGFVAAYLISVPLGIIKGVRHGGVFDLGSSALVFIGYSIPGWALGMVLLAMFASSRASDAGLDYLPLGDIKTSTYNDLPDIVKQREPRAEVSNRFGDFVWERMSVTSKLIDTLWHLFPPVLCYMLGQFATVTILMKNSLMENLGQDYVRTAFAKGVSPRRVILVHALRNSLIPLATGLGHALSLIMAGSYLIELVFNIDGIGLLGYSSIINYDYTVVLGVLSINTILILMGNIFSDVLYAMIDPRIRFE